MFFQGYQQAKALTERAATLLQSGQLAQAQEIWQEAEREASSVRSASWQALALRPLIKVLAKAQLWQEAERLTVSLRDPYWHVRTLRSLTKILTKAQQWQEAERLTTSISDAAYRALALRCLARDLAKASQFQEAERIAFSIDDTPHRAIALYNIAVMLAGRGYKTQAQAIHQEAAKAMASTLQNLPQKQIVSDAYALRDLAATLTRTHQWQEAANVASSIQDISVQMYALGELTIALDKAKQHSLAQDFWQKIERVASQQGNWGNFLLQYLAKKRKIILK